MPINYLDTEEQRIYNMKAINLNNWNRRVADMNGFSIPNEYDMQGITGKYKRFTGFIQRWVEELLATDIDDGEGVLESNNTIYNLSQKRSGLMVNWWNVAQKIGSGKNVNNTLPKFQEITEENKQFVYDAFLPAYRAIKESFQKRSVFEWIFNHSQYVAERDSLRALEGIITTLTGDNKEGIQQRLDEYVNEIPSGDISVAARTLQERIQRQLNENSDSAMLENGALELNEIVNVDDNVKENQTDEIELDDMQSNIHVEADNVIRFAKILTGEGFEDEIIGQMKNAIPKDVKLNVTAQEILLKRSAFGRIIERAVNDFNNNMDDAIEEQEDIDIERLNSVAMDGIKDVFSEAYATAKLLPLSLKDRLLVAQRFSDIALNAASPVAFQKEAFGHCGNGFMLMMTDFNMIKSVVETHFTEKERFTDDEIEAAYNQARTEFELEMKRIPIQIDDFDESSKDNIVEKQIDGKQIDPHVSSK